MRVYIKSGDTVPPIRQILKSKGSILDLTDATVEFWMTLDLTSAAENSIGGACSVIDAEGGEVEYVWADGDTDVPGTYFGEFVVTTTVEEEEEDPVVDVQRIPDHGWITIEVGRSVALVEENDP